MRPVVVGLTDAEKATLGRRCLGGAEPSPLMVRAVADLIDARVARAERDTADWWLKLAMEHIAELAPDADPAYAAALHDAAREVASLRVLARGERSTR